MSKDSPIWSQAALKTLKVWQTEVSSAAEHMSDHASIVNQMDSHRQWLCCRLLLGDADLTQLLLDLSGALHQWIDFDDHGMSREQGKLREHLEADRLLTSAVCNLVDDLTTRAAEDDHCRAADKKNAADDGIQPSAEQLAEHLGRHLDPMGVPRYRLPAGSCGPLVDALLAWMDGEVCAAQRLADAVVALPDLLKQQEVAR